MTPVAYQQITALSSATGITVPAGAVWATIAVEAAGVRYRIDATAPTATVGMPLAEGTSAEFDLNVLRAIQFIEQSDGAILNVSFYGSDFA